MTLSKKVWPEGQLKNNSDLFIHGHSSNRSWNRQNMFEFIEHFIVERLQHRCLADQKKIIEKMYSPVATKKMCLAMFCSGEEDERDLAAYFKSLGLSLDFNLIDFKKYSGLSNLVTCPFFHFSIKYN